MTSETFLSRKFLLAVCYIFTGILLHSCREKSVSENTVAWPSISSETKPWTRWWWHGNVVTEEGITAELEALKTAGIGGVEITPIYGVYGYEDKFIQYLSPEWIERLLYTLKEADRLGLGVDMATGTGWPFGGPWVTDANACRNFRYKIYPLKGGQSLPYTIEFIQEPFLRAVGNRLQALSYINKGTHRLIDTHPITIADLVQPISANKNLQALAIDQVQFEKQLPLKTVMAYNGQGVCLDLTNKVDGKGKLNWIAPSGEWTLYALFEGWHGKLVERAGPGGEGNVIDHFSKGALTNYLNRFDSALHNHDIRSLRAFFNDSYEVDDARGSANWTPALFDEFKKRRGYDLRLHLPALTGNDIAEKNERIICDYRETISELLLENFTQQWKEWAHGKSALVRNQAHGSPANILDLYSVVDIPEVEGVEPLRIRMASSAGNVSGKKLISAEAATWLNEHFESNWSEVKVALDRFMLNGVNHLVYHGTAYSPVNEPWPGWLFYAAVHFNTRNPLWNDFNALNNYVARCQAFLQGSSPDNDVLLYYPVYDPFSVPGDELIQHFDGIGKQFEGTSFARCAETMMENGYTFDYISDKQLRQLQYQKDALVTEAGTAYRAIVIPYCKYIPVQTLERAHDLLSKGATVIFFEGLPQEFSGFGYLDENKRKFRELISALKGQKIKSGDSIRQLLSKAGIRRESLVDQGIGYIRKKDKEGRTFYLINNLTTDPFNGWIRLDAQAENVDIFDPMTGATGKGSIHSKEKSKTSVYVQLMPNQSLILRMNLKDEANPPFPFYVPLAEARPLTGPWKITFYSGGPSLPSPIKIDSLISWTNFGGEYAAFSGSADYVTTFGDPGYTTTHWKLNLGVVKESARVYLNGAFLGTMIGPDFSLTFSSTLLKKENELKVTVSNLMANRIADMDRRGILWKKFYNVNFPARKTENRKDGLFDASSWLAKPSGLIGPVQITPVKIYQNPEE
jgi:hypothetical protein